MGRGERRSEMEGREDEGGEGGAGREKGGRMRSGGGGGIGGRNEEEEEEREEEGGGIRRGRSGNVAEGEVGEGRRRKTRITRRRSRGRIIVRK